MPSSRTCPASIPDTRLTTRKPLRRSSSSPKAPCVKSSESICAACSWRPGTGTLTSSTRCPIRSHNARSCAATARLLSRSVAFSRDTMRNSLGADGAPSDARVAGLTKAYNTCSIQPGARLPSRAIPVTPSRTSGPPSRRKVIVSPRRRCANSTDECSATSAPSPGGQLPVSRTTRPTSCRARSGAEKRIAVRHSPPALTLATVRRRASAERTAGCARTAARSGALTESR